MNTLQHLVEARDLAVAKLKIHNLKGDKLENDMEKAISELQENCPHEHTAQNSQYHSGGYDYQSSTSYWIVCDTCNNTLESWEKQSGYFG